MNNQKQGKKEIKYLIKQKDWPDNYNTQLKTYLYLQNTIELVNKYHKSYNLNEPTRKKPSTRKEPISPRKYRRPQKKKR